MCRRSRYDFQRLPRVVVVRYRPARPISTTQPPALSLPPTLIITGIEMSYQLSRVFCPGGLIPVPGQGAVCDNVMTFVQSRVHHA